MDIRNKRQHGILKVIALLIVSAALMSACTKTKPPRFYVLNATLKQAPAADSQQVSAVGIRLVSMPKFMDRPQIAERVGAHEIKLAEFDRWAGPLDENISLVLGDNLSALLPDTRVLTFPWQPSQQPEMQADLMIRRFDGKVGGDVVLEADWNIRRTDGSIAPGSKTFTRKTADEQYASLVAVKSALLADLSKELAAGIEAHQ